MDPKIVQDILESLNETGAKYLKIETANKKIEIVRSSSLTPKPVVVVKEPVVETVPEPKEDDSTHDIRSPYIGFFQRSTTLGEKPVAKLREVVEKGTVVAYIRSMNLQYEVTADHEGKISEVLVEDGQAVEFGQPLFRLKLN